MITSSSSSSYLYIYIRRVQQIDQPIHTYYIKVKRGETQKRKKIKRDKREN